MDSAMYKWHMMIMTYTEQSERTISGAVAYFSYSQKFPQKFAKRVSLFNSEEFK